MSKNLVNELTIIRDAQELLFEGNVKCLFVLDGKGKLIGTLTDGDIRRGILQGYKTNEEIKDIFNPNPLYLNKKDLGSVDFYSIATENQNIRYIPILDDIQKYLDYIDISNYRENSKTSSLSNTPVVIMAGGKGVRMAPFTSVLPKPLLPIHDKPIIEHIIESFLDFSCINFYVSLNYKKKIMMAYFEELDREYNVNFVEETNYLGTAGSLRLLLNKFSSPFFVTNCDIIVKTDYEKLMQFHKQNNFDITIVASTKQYVIPYGTCEIKDNGVLSHINEKPSYDFLVNTGLYVLNPDMLEIIPEDTLFHITHLIENAKDNGFNVGVFPVSENSWIDVGQWKEYKNALEQIGGHD